MIKKNTFICFICFIILACTLLVSACESDTNNSLEFGLLTDDTYCVKGIKNEEVTKIEIPSSYNGKAVRKIARNAFNSCTNLTTVVVPEGIETIESYAFKGCSALTDISLPNSIEEIETGAFDGCNSLQYNQYENGRYLGNGDNKYVALICGIDKNVTSFNVNENCSVIYENALYGFSNMTSIKLPNSIKYLGESVFNQCTSLKSFVVPNQVEYFYSSWFDFCSSLQSITLSANIKMVSINYMYGCDSFAEFRVYSTNAKYTAEDGVLYSKDRKTLLAYPIAKSGDNFNVPSYVETIATYAFNGCLNLKSLTMWGTIKELNSSCVINCDLLQTLNFKGTMNEWITVDNANIGWDNSFSVNRVICSDGVLSRHEA